MPESKVLPSTHVVADLLGIPRYFACTMPSNLRKKRAQNKERYQFKTINAERKLLEQPRVPATKLILRRKGLPRVLGTKLALTRKGLPDVPSIGLTFPPMRAKAFLMLTGVHTKPVLHAPSHQCSTTLHTLSCHLPKKHPETRHRKSTCACVGSLCMPSSVHCRLFRWFLVNCFLVEVHPYMSAWFLHFL